MILIDSCGWIEFFTKGTLSDKYAKYMKEYSRILTPTVVLYEVYKKIKKEQDEETAILYVAQLQKTKIAPLTSSISLAAADFSLKYSLPMADSIVYATACDSRCQIVTSDLHFKKLPNVIFLSR